MSNGSTSNNATPAVDLRPLYVLAAFTSGAVIVGVILALVLLRTHLAPPTPTDPLPADVRAWWVATADAWDATAADLDSGKIHEDVGQVTAKIGEYRKAANDTLFSDFPAGRWPARLRDAAKVTRSLAGKK